MAFTIDSSISGLTNSGNTSERFEVKYDFVNGITVYKKDIKKNINNNFIEQFIVVVVHYSKDMFIFDTDANRNDFYDTFS